VSGCVAGILETGALYIEGIAREGTG
jgi:hypothetical protein